MVLVSSSIGRPRQRPRGVQGVGECWRGSKHMYRTRGLVVVNRAAATSRVPPIMSR